MRVKFCGHTLMCFLIWVVGKWMKNDLTLAKLHICMLWYYAHVDKTFQLCSSKPCKLFTTKTHAPQSACFQQRHPH